MFAPVVMRPIALRPSVNHIALSGPVVMALAPYGPLLGKRVILPPVVMRPIALLSKLMVNHSAPSGPDVIPNGPLMPCTPFLLNAATVPTVVMGPIEFVPWLVNHKAPSGPAAIPCGRLMELEDTVTAAADRASAGAALAGCSAATAPSIAAGHRYRAGWCFMLRIGMRSFTPASGGPSRSAIREPGTACYGRSCRTALPVRCHIPPCTTCGVNSRTIRKPGRAAGLWPGIGQEADS